MTVQPSAGASLATFQPLVDLENGGIFAIEVTPGRLAGGPATPEAMAIHEAGSRESLLPVLVRVPTNHLIVGTSALDPLYQSLHKTGRRPGSVILALEGQLFPALARTVGVLRSQGFHIGIGGAGGPGVPLRALAELTPFVIEVGVDVVAQLPADRRYFPVAEAIAGLAHALGAHALAPGVTGENQLAHLRRAGIRLAQGPALAPPGWRPGDPITTPIPAVPAEDSVADVGPRISESTLPGMTLPIDATAEDVLEIFTAEPSLTSIVLVDEPGRPRATLDRTRFLLTVSGPYGHALHARRPAIRLADRPRIVPRTVPAIAALRAAGDERERVYDDLVVVNEIGGFLGIARIGDLIRLLPGHRNVIS